MSDSDSFIREVSEEVRRDRMFRLWKKYGPWAISAIVLVIAGAAGLTWWQHRQEEAARVLGGAFLDSEIAAIEAQEELLARVEGAPAEVLARLRLAAAHAESDRAEDAAALYWEVASTPGLAPLYADFARLQAVRLRLETMAPSEAVAELEPLVAEGAPYRLLALELRAVARLNANETEAAHADLNAILESDAATRDLMERAAALLVSSGGELPARLGGTVDIRGES